MEKPIEQTPSEVSTEDIQSEFDLKKAEFALKQREFNTKLKGERRNIWFTSPLVVGVLSAIVGLLGTGVGAIFQGYWNTQLERQKFESVLIQKALEQKDRDEVAKSLLFLVEAGLIQSLNRENIAGLAKKPDQLPLYRTAGPSGESIEYRVDEGGQVAFISNWSETDIIEVEVPQLRGIQGAPQSGKIKFYKAATVDLKAAWAEIEQQNLLTLVKSWDGSYNPRTIRAMPSRLSAHALGIAFDINTKWQTFGREPVEQGAEGSVRELVPIFEKHNFFWGGNFTGHNKDGGHFEWKKGKNSLGKR
jgi:hypothetical protein